MTLLRESPQSHNIRPQGRSDSANSVLGRLFVVDGDEWHFTYVER